MLLLIPILLTTSCNGQPKTTYTIGNYDANGVIIPVPGATSYAYFLEQGAPNADYLLYDGMDYLNPNVTQLQLGVSTSPSWDILLPNDGSEYAVGMVAIDSQGFYGAMGVGIDNVSIVPTKPGGVRLRKK